MTHFCPKCGTGFTEEDGESCPKDGTSLRPVEGNEDRLIGRLIQDRFRLVDVIGRGGAGVVYRAIQLPIGREVAVKVVADTLQQGDATRERFFREAKLASSLRHPNIVSPVDFGEDSKRGVVYFAMEYIAGIDLHDLIDGHRITVPLALEILYQTCGALTDAHDKGIIHRDLKPRNLRLVAVSDGSMQVKVLDLGIARPMDGKEDITQEGNITGTITYLPPEYVVEGRLCAPSDLYSLGIMFFEMLTGHKPFDGNPMQVMFHHIKTPPPSLKAALPDGEIEDEIEAFYLKLVEKTPEDRFETARAVRARIDEIRKKHKIATIAVDNSTTQETSVATFRAWLKEAANNPGESISLPTDILSSLRGAAAERLEKKKALPEVAVEPVSEEKPGPPALPGQKKKADDDGEDLLAVEELDQLEPLDEDDLEVLDEDALEVLEDDEVEAVEDDEAGEVEVFDEFEELAILDSFERQSSLSSQKRNLFIGVGLAVLLVGALGIALKPSSAKERDEGTEQVVVDASEAEDEPLAEVAVDEEQDELFFEDFEEPESSAEEFLKDLLAEEEEMEEVAEEPVVEEPRRSAQSGGRTTSTSRRQPAAEAEAVDPLEQLLRQAGNP